MWESRARGAPGSVMSRFRSRWKSEEVWTWTHVWVSETSEGLILVGRVCPDPLPGLFRKCG